MTMARCVDLFLVIELVNSLDDNTIFHLNFLMGKNKLCCIMYILL